MIKSKKLLIALVVILLVAISISFLLLRSSNDAKPLKAGDTDPETGCLVTESGEICPGVTGN